MLGKRANFTRLLVAAESSEEEEGDLMKQARQLIVHRDATTKVQLKEKEKEEAPRVNSRLNEILDPSTKKLFEMLPAPKQSAG